MAVNSPKMMLYFSRRKPFSSQACMLHLPVRGWDGLEKEITLSCADLEEVTCVFSLVVSVGSC